MPHDVTSSVVKCCAGILCSLLLLSAQTAVAQAPTFTVDPRVSPEIDERIVGQTGDLAWERTAATDTNVANPPLARASAVSAGAARVVVGVEDEGDTLLVTIVDLAQRRVLQREITVGAPRERSAALEAAALVIRGALQTLGDGGEIGVRAPEPPAAPPPPDPAPEPEPDPEVDVATPRSTTRALRLAFTAGASPIVEGAWAARVGASLLGELGHLMISVELGGAVPRRVEGQDQTALQLGALVVGARVGYVYRGTVDVLPFAGLYLVGVRRLTTETAAGFAPTGANRSMQARAQAGLGVRRRFGRVALFLDLGVEVAFSRLRFAADGPMGRVQTAETPRVLPVLGVGVSLDLAVD